METQPTWNDVEHARCLTAQLEGQLVDAVLNREEGAVEKFLELFRPLVTAIARRWAAHWAVRRDGLYSEDDLVDLAFVYVIRGIRDSELGPAEQDGPARRQSESPLSRWDRQSRLATFVGSWTSGYLSDFRRVRRQLSKGKQALDESDELELSGWAGIVRKGMTLDEEIAFRQQFERCLARLDPQGRALVIAMLGETSLGETARGLGISVPTASRRRRRAIERLKECFRA